MSRLPSPPVQSPKPIHNMPACCELSWNKLKIAVFDTQNRRLGSKLSHKFDTETSVYWRSHCKRSTLTHAVNTRIDGSVLVQYSGQTFLLKVQDFCGHNIHLRWRSSYIRSSQSDVTLTSFAKHDLISDFKPASSHAYLGEAKTASLYSTRQSLNQQHLGHHSTPVAAPKQ